VTVSWRGRVGGAGRGPIVSIGIVSPATVESVAGLINATPYDHFAAGPNCGGGFSATRRLSGASRRPTVGIRMVSAARAGGGPVKSSPNNHLSAGRDCSVIAPRRGRIDGAGCGPTVTVGIVSAASVHLIISPDCRVKGSRRGCITGASGCPSVRAGIVPSTRVYNIITASIASTPDDHFTPGPDHRMCGPRRRRIGGAGDRPTVGAGIVFSAGVQNVVSSIKEVPAPNNHFAPCPDCRVKISGGGRVDEARWSPGIIDAASGRS